MKAKDLLESSAQHENILQPVEIAKKVNSVLKGLGFKKHEEKTSASIHRTWFREGSKELPYDVTTDEGVDRLIKDLNAIGLTFKNYDGRNWGKHTESVEIAAEVPRDTARLTGKRDVEVSIGKYKGFSEYKGRTITVTVAKNNPGGDRFRRGYDA